MAHPKELNIGLGTQVTATARTEWPNGDADLFEDVAANHRYHVHQAGTPDRFIQC